MNITAMEINSKEFRTSLRGYDKEEVDEFLQDIAEDYENVFRENSSFKERISALDEKLEHYKKIEDTIQNTLVLAQNAAEEAKKSAQKESELIIKNANESAQKMIDDANKNVTKINQEYDNLKNEYLKFKYKFKNFISSQMEIFDSLDKEMNKDDKNDAAKAPDENEEEKVSEEAAAEEEEDKSFSDDDLSSVKTFYAEDEEDNEKDKDKEE